MADTKYKVRCSNGAIPNDNYVVKEVSGKYKVNRGAGAYKIGEYSSHIEAVAAIQADGESKGASGVTVSPA